MAALAPSRNTELWLEILAAPQIGRIPSIMSECWAPHSKVCRAPMLKPITRRGRRIANPSVTSRCCARTLSWTVINGNRGPSNGGGLLLGDEDAEFDSMLITTTQ